MILAALSIFFIIMCMAFAVVLLALFIAGRIFILKLARKQAVKMPFMVFIPFIGDLFEGRLIRHFTKDRFVIAILYFIARILPYTFVYYVTLGPGFLYPYDSLEEIAILAMTMGGLSLASILRIVAMIRGGVDKLMAISIGIFIPDLWSLFILGQKNKA